MDKFFKFKFDELFNPTIEALHYLGGSCSIDELEEKVTEILNLSEEQISEIHRENRTKLRYRLSWARNYLKRYGLLENSSKGIWTLTEKGLKIHQVDPKVVKKNVKESSTKNKNKKDSGDVVLEEIDTNNSWQDIIIDVVKKIHPDQFERLCQRILRELGFLNVEVTGKANDGGIDGIGMLRLGGVMSFHVVFQAKRYKDSVGSSVVRDFRGAMIGRADKGLIITTGNFTREAKKEARRDGAPPIDLIDGSDLAEKLKDLKLGVEIELVEKVNVNTKWFDTL